LRIIRRPKFLVGLDEAYRWIARDSTPAGERLLESVRATVERVKRYPMTGTPREDLAPELRSIRVRPFRHLIFYRFSDQELELIRLLRGARALEKQDYKP
jgi:toxin ParE1/3/4